VRVLLIRPPVPRHTIGLKSVMVCEPLELEYVAAHLDGHDVEILDLILERGLERRLRRFRPDVVGTSSYIAGVNEAIRICRAAKRWNPDVRTVVGGVHASRVPEDFADDSVDCIVRGDGTTMMPRLLQAFASGRPLDEVPGLAIPRDGGLVRTAPAAYMPHPDELAFPRRDLVKHLRHRYYYLYHQPVATVKTTWGCWYECNFCFTWRITDGATYSRSPESIAEELAGIECEDVYIVDDIFLFDRRRLGRLAALLRERNIRKKYLVYGRADFIARNEDVIEEWADLGLRAVLIGLEATTDPELASMDKRTTVDDNRRAIEVLRRHGVDTYGSIIVRPDYGPDDWKRLQAFVEETGLYYLNLSPLTPLPGTATFRRYESSLAVSRRAHGLWDLCHVVLPTAMPLKKYYRSLLSVYARTALDPRRARRLTLRTMPPVGSWRFLRLWTGALKIAGQFLVAHRHHSERVQARAEERGPAPPPRRREEPTPNPRPVEPAAVVTRAPDFAPAPPGSLLDIPRASAWLEAVARCVDDDQYTYQRVLDGRTGPYVTVEGRRFLMMSSYDYLGLIGHEGIERATRRAIDEHGTGSGGVRLLTGTNRLHVEVEEELARFRGVEAALTFTSGYGANLAVIPALVGPGDRVIVDERVHRSVLDGCRLSGARIESFRHNDPESLEHHLRRRPSGGRTLIIAEGVYSMDGDVCPLPEIVQLRERYGAFLMLDEAHSFGALGATGRGAPEHFGIPPGEIDLCMGSLSKAIPSTGGFVAGSRELIVYLQHEAAPFFYSAALAPPCAAAALAALGVIETEPWRLEASARIAAALRAGLRKRGHDVGTSATSIVPVIQGNRDATLALARGLTDEGILVSAVVHPAVARDASRLRLCAMATHREADVERFLASLDRVVRRGNGDLYPAPDRAGHASHV